MRFRSLIAVLRKSREPIVMVVTLALVLLFAFTVLAFPMGDDPLEDQEISAGASWGVISVAVPFNSPFFVVALASGFIATILVPEYLSSHIGEKRFANGTFRSPLFASLLGFLVTALSAVPSLFYSCRLSWNVMSSQLAVFRYCAPSPIVG